MALQPVAGSRIYIGNQLDDKSADFVAGDFTAQSWVEIDGWTQMGAIGDTAQLISTDLINRGRTVKQKGTFNAGQMQNVFAYLPLDDGQILLRSARDQRANYSFRVVFETTEEKLFIALVMNAEDAGGNANTILNENVTLEINSNIVTVAAV